MIRSFGASHLVKQSKHKYLFIVSIYEYLAPKKCIFEYKFTKQILEIVNIFRSKVVDISDKSITIEISGDAGKITTIQKLLMPYGIIEIVRTGKIAIPRELGINTEFLKNI